MNKETDTVSDAKWVIKDAAGSHEAIRLRDLAPGQPFRFVVPGAVTGEEYPHVENLGVCIRVGLNGMNFPFMYGNGDLAMGQGWLDGQVIPLQRVVIEKED